MKHFKIINQSGFTLIELILGLAIISMIGLTVYSTFAGGLQLSHRAEGQNEIYREMYGVFDLIAKDLENMVPYNFSNSYEDRRAFVGKESNITFIISSDKGLKVVRYYLIIPESGGVHQTIIAKATKKNVSVTTGEFSSVRVNYLVREEKDFIDYLNNVSSVEENKEIIGINIKERGLKFSYGYLEQEESEKYSWRAGWSYKTIPSIVKVQIDFLIQEKQSRVMPLSRTVLIPHGSLQEEKVKDESQNAQEQPTEDLIGNEI